MDTALDILLQNARSINAHTGKIYGVVPAKVLKVFDDDAQKRHLLGMVQIWFPWLQDKDDPKLIKPWARMCMPAAGRGFVENDAPNAFDNASKKEGAGFYTPPTIGDEVLVGFEQGDIHFPYILGTLWNGVDKIPMVSDVTNRFAVTDSVKGPEGSRHDSDAGGNSHAAITDPALAQKEKVGTKDGPNANKLWYWRSRSGHLVIFDDTEETPKVIITTASGKERVVLDENKHKVQIVSGFCPCALQNMHTPEYKPHTCVPREPLEGDGALGNQETGAGDNVNGGDIEILAKNRVWIKARKINLISSHNTNIDAGNLYRIHSRGKMTFKSGLNMAFQVGRALQFDVGQPPMPECKPPANAPMTPLTPLKVGQWVVKTSGQISITSQGVPTVGTKDIVIKAFPLGSVDIMVFKDLSIKVMTGDTQLLTLLGSTTVLSLKAITVLCATASITMIALGGHNRITPGPILDMAGGAINTMSGALILKFAPIILLN